MNLTRYKREPLLLVSVTLETISLCPVCVSSETLPKPLAIRHRQERMGLASVTAVHVHTVALIFCGQGWRHLPIRIQKHLSNSWSSFKNETDGNNAEFGTQE